MTTVLANVPSNQRIVVAAPPRPGDLNADGTIGFADLSAMLADWGPCPGCPYETGLTLGASGLHSTQCCRELLVSQVSGADDSLTRQA